MPVHNGSCATKWQPTRSGHSAGASASTVQHNQPSSKEDLDKLPVSRNLARLLDLTFATEQSMYGKIGKLEKNVSELGKTIAMRDETIRICETNCTKPTPTPLREARPCARSRGPA